VELKSRREQRLTVLVRARQRERRNRPAALRRQRAHGCDEARAIVRVAQLDDDHVGADAIQHRARRVRRRARRHERARVRERLREELAPLDVITHEQNVHTAERGRAWATSRHVNDEVQGRCRLSARPAGPTYGRSRRVT